MSRTYSNLRGDPSRTEIIATSHVHRCGNSSSFTATMHIIRALTLLVGLAYGQSQEWMVILSHAEELARQNDHAAADFEYERALARAADSGDGGVAVAVVQDRAAFHDQELGRSSSAIRRYEAAIVVFSQTGQEQRLTEAAVGLSSVHMERGEISKAKSLIYGILAREGIFFPEAKAMLLLNLGSALVLEGELREGEQQFDAVLETLEVQAAEGLSERAKQLIVKTLSNLAGIYCVTGRVPKAFAYSMRAQRELKLLGNAPIDLQIKTLAGAGSIASVASKWDDARKLYAESIRLCEQGLGSRHPLLGSLLLNYSGILAHFGQKQEAKLVRAQANAILQNSRRENGAEQIVDVSQLKTERANAGKIVLR